MLNNLQGIEEKRVILQEYYQVVFGYNIKGMADMARKYAGYAGNNDFINNCTEEQVDTFLRKYERSYINCKAAFGGGFIDG